MSTPNPLSAALSPKPFVGIGQPERLGPPATLDATQQAAADELIRGPRKGVYGPFRPLLQRPPILGAAAALGETLRFKGTLARTLSADLAAEQALAQVSCLYSGRVVAM